MDKKKVFMIVSICILVLSIVGSTLAYYRLVLFDDLTVDTITHGLDYYINYTGGTNIDSATLQLVDSYTEATSSSTEVSFYKNDNTYDIYGHIYLDINSIGENTRNSDSLKYTVVNTTTGVVLSSGKLKDRIEGNRALIKSNIPLKTTEELFKIYIWLDINENVDTNMEGENLSLTVKAEATMKQIEDPVNVVDYISNLYKYSSKSVVVNNEIDYNYATSVSLMNDRLGGTTKDYDAGNIRYYGSNPNNYIDIGDYYKEDTVINNMEKNSIIMQISRNFVTDEESCHAYFDCDTNYIRLQTNGLTFKNASECKKLFDYESTDEICGTEIKEAGETVLYRIIGIFKDMELADGTKKDLIKLVREDSIGIYSWDLDEVLEDGTKIKSNDWHNSTLNNILNNGYLGNGTNLKSMHISPVDLSVTEENVNFSEKGIKSIEDKIESVVWNLGGYDSSEVYANDIYEYERADAKCNDCTYKTKWTGKVALAYPSDHGYGADFTQCNSKLWDYVSCNSVNWMSSVVNGTYVEWLLTPKIGEETYYSWAINNIRISHMYGIIYGLGVRPTFYLDASQNIIYGDGSEDNPYVLG